MSYQSPFTGTVYSSRYNYRTTERYDACQFRLTRYVKDPYLSLARWLYISVSKMRLAGVPKDLYAYMLHQYIDDPALNCQISRRLNGHDYPDFEEFIELLIQPLANRPTTYDQTLDSIISASREVHEPGYKHSHALPL